MQASRSNDEALIDQASLLIAEQQETNPPLSTYDLKKTQILVETAMLAAVTGLAYTLSSLLRLEGYVSYFLNLPVILASMRSGISPGIKTAVVAFLLLFILMGPFKAVTYFCLYGLMGVVLGSCWSAKLPWTISIPLGAASRIVGYFAYVCAASWATNENLWALLAVNTYSLLDQMSSLIGSTGVPSPMVVGITLASVLFVSAMFYVALTHILYAIVLKGLGLDMRLPKSMEKYIATR